MKRLVRAGAGVLALVVASGVANAQANHPPPPVELRLDPSVEACVGSGTLDTVRRAVRLDLGAELVSDDREDATHVDVSCSGEAATIRIDDPLTGKIVERRVEFGQQPLAGRARLLGVTIAETVAASWVELEMVGSEETHPAPAAEVAARPTVRSDAAAVAQARLRRHPPRDGAPLPTLALAPAVLYFGRDDVLAVGARLDGRWPLGEWFAVELDLGGEWGRVATAAGDVDACLFSMAPRVAARVRTLGVELAASLGFRLGLVDLSGTSKTEGLVARSFLAPWGGPVADVTARLALARHFAVALGLEAGRVTLAVEGQVDDARAAGISGWWGGAWLSFVYLP